MSIHTRDLMSRWNPNGSCERKVCLGNVWKNWEHIKEPSSFFFFLRAGRRGGNR